MPSSYRREYLVRLPLPLAQLYSRANNDKDPRSRHDNAFYLCEALVKLAAVAPIACYLDEVELGAARLPQLDRLLAQLALPSLGQWLAMLRELSRHFGQRADASAHPLGHIWQQLTVPRRDVPGMLALFRRIKNGVDGQPGGDQSCSLLDFFDKLVQYRNGVFGHGGPRFASFFAEEMGPLLLPAVNELVESAAGLLGPPEARLLYLTEMRTVDENQVEVGLRELTGLRAERMAPLMLTRGQAAKLLPNRVALLWPGRAVPLRLDPLLHYRENETAEEVLFLNRDRNGKQVEYLSYTTGRTERDRNTAPELAALLSRIVNHEVGAEQLAALAEQSQAETPSVEALFERAPTSSRQLGEYEILAELGRGGMGVVFLARQMSLGRLVALKTLPADLAGDAVALARFRREIRHLARCDHPNIVKVLASGILPDGQLYYTMEYVPGCSLEQVWRELSSAPPTTAAHLDSTSWTRAVLSASRKQRAQSSARQMAGSTAVTEETNVSTATAPAFGGKLEDVLPPLPEQPALPVDVGSYARRVAQLMRDSASALQAVHDQGLVHRDIKPANLMLTPDGQRVVLMDFGLVKGHSASLEASRQGGLLGTLRYAAPEQLAAANVTVGPAADVRGLGGSFWELLTRRRLFGEAEDERQLASKVLQEDVPRLRTVDADLDRDLEAIVARATERSVAQRIASAGQVAEYVDLYLQGKPLPIRPPGIVELAGRWLRRRKALVGSAAALVAALLLGTTLILVLLGQRRQLEQDVETGTLALRPLLERGRWAEAGEILTRLESHIGEKGPAELVQRLQQTRKDLKMAEQLEEIPLFRMAVTEDGPNNKGADESYETAFRDYGLDVLDTDTAASQIRDSTIREALLAALDRWMALKQDRRAKPESWHALVAVANQADNLDSRKQIRAALKNGNRLEIEELAQHADLARLPPATIDLLALALTRAAAKQPSAAEFLRRGQLRYPNDLWINFTLGQIARTAKPPRMREAIGYYRAALAMRPGNAGILLNLGVALEKAGKLVEAEAANREVLRIKPDYADAYTNLGNDLHAQGKLDEAVAAFKDAIRLSPKGAMAHYNLGLVLLQQARLDDAVAAHRNAIRCQPTYADAWLSLGQALQDQGKLDEAVGAYNKAIQLNPEQANNYNSLGNALHIQKKGEQAVVAYRQAIKLQPDLPKAHNNLAKALSDLGKNDEAVAIYNEGIRIAPSDFVLYYNKAITLQDQRKLDDAVASYRAAILFKADFADAYDGLGIALQAQGKLNEAVQAYREAIGLQPDLASAHYNLGLALKRLSKPVDAVIAYRASLRLRPDFADAHNALGVALKVQGKLAEALIEYREAIRLKPVFADAWNNLGLALHAQRKHADAAGAYQQAIHVQPTLAMAHYNLGITRDVQGKVSDAIAAYREAIRLKPDYADAYNNLGIRLRAQGKLDQAVGAYREAIRFNPDLPNVHLNLGFALQQQCEFAPSLASFRRGHELGIKTRGWSNPSADWVRKAEQLADADRRLPAILKGKAQPADASEAALLGWLCQQPYRRLCAASARFYTEAFAAQPLLAEDFAAGHRYDAACSAALAGSGNGKDSAALTDAERANWRQQALDWLRADLKHRAQQVASMDKKSRDDAKRSLTYWRNDSDLAGIRDVKGLAALPAAERERWRQFWSDVDGVLKRISPE